MLMMIQKGIRGGICRAVYRYVKVNNKHTKNYDKNIESLCSECWDSNHLCGWAVSQKLPVDGFEWVEEDDLLKSNEIFIKNYDETVIRDIFLKQMLNIPKIFMNYIVT